jgi:SAM-dependent methyltransferase
MTPFIGLQRRSLDPLDRLLLDRKRTRAPRPAGRYGSAMEPVRRRGSEYHEFSHLPPGEAPMESLGEMRLDYIERNRSAWQGWAPGYITAGRRAWQAEELQWGLWNTPESQLRLLSGFEAGDDAIELGCGTAAISAWMARRGLRPVAVDFARAQLRTADALQGDFGVSFRLVHANAEEVPFEDESFDLVISEYGASLWSDPRRWVPEAHRLLRPEGRLVFFTISSLLLTCTPLDGSPVADQLVRDYFSRFRVEFEPDGAVEFHLTNGQWIALLRSAGFVIDALVEVQPDLEAQPRFALVSSEWAHRWPSEEIWVAHKAG